MYEDTWAVLKSLVGTHSKQPKHQCPYRTKSTRSSLLLLFLVVLVQAAAEGEFEGVSGRRDYVHSDHGTALLSNAGYRD
jgi:hypothetical protein